MANSAFKKGTPVGAITSSSTDTLTNKTIDANGTGNSISNIDVADLANGTDGELITWSATGTPTTVSVGTADQVLTSNGAGAAPTFQDAAGGAVPRNRYYTIFEDAGAFAESGSGASTFGTTGVTQTSSASSGNYTLLQRHSSDTEFKVFSNSPTWGCSIAAVNENNAGEIYLGMGSNITIDGSGITLTDNHIGFKIIVSGGTANVYGTVATGGTETATASLGVVNSSQNWDLVLKVNGSTSVDFYAIKQGGASPSPTTITTTLNQTSDRGIFTFGCSNANTANNTTVLLESAFYQRDF